MQLCAEKIAKHQRILFGFLDIVTFLSVEDLSKYGFLTISNLYFFKFEVAMRNMWKYS